MSLGEKREIRDQSHIFFLENIKFRKFLPRAPNFEYPPLILYFTNCILRIKICLNQKFFKPEKKMIKSFITIQCTIVTQYVVVTVMRLCQSLLKNHFRLASTTNVEGIFFASHRALARKKSKKLNKITKECFISRS